MIATVPLKVISTSVSSEESFSACWLSSSLSSEKTSDGDNYSFGMAYGENGNFLGKATYQGFRPIVVP